jgi:hypothetical protein
MNRDLFEKHLDDLSSRINNSVHNELYIRVNSDTVHTQVYLNINKLNEIWLSIFHMKEDLHLNTIPNINGLKIENIAHENGRNGTKIGKEGSHDDKVYYHFLCHLAEELFELNKADHTKRKLQHLLHTWQEFFKGDRKPLGDRAQLGLMGELTVLKDCVLTELNSKKALKSWTGPLRGLHDFVFNSCNIEVKSSIGINNRRFIIHGENQLQIPLEKQLFLFNPIFENSDDGESLSDMVASIKSIIKSDLLISEVMDNLLSKVGYHAIHSEHYTNQGLNLTKSDMIKYQVGDGFPRLLPSSSGDFISVNDYVIDTKGCENFIHKEMIRLD